ncbi:MAG: tryptophan synthase subunit alpha [Thermoflexaceae bacterium]|nr:tryptophan synthase subunit alpha [Thermoflexaceae bacterium]
MNRIEERLSQLKKENKKALITYVTAGLPSIEKTIELVKAQEEAGIDVIELGIPFSDPVADGPVIQDASYRSIQNGTNLKMVFEAMTELRKTSQVPIVFMMYYNTILHYGVKEFVEKCIDTGVDGLIVPDLPFEEQGEIRQYLDGQDALIQIQLVSPVSKQRVPMILENARGFVYCVSQMGVTGKGANFHKDIRNYLSEVKAVSKIPVMMGFGIRSAADVEPLRDIIDGAIVGSAFIKLMDANDFDANVAKEYVAKFKKELN